MPTDHEWKIAVCDDLEGDLQQTKTMTGQILREAGIPYSIAQYHSASALLADIRSGVKYHLLILDVMMEEMDGIALAGELRKQGNSTSIIFVSSNREMAMYGYEVSALRYLAKPLDTEKLKEALAHCCQLWQEKKEILLPTEQGQCRTSFSKIQYAEAFDRGTRFFLDGEVLETRLKFSEVEAMLPKSAFLLCHRAFLVNLAWVRYIRNYEFELKNGRTVPIGKARYSAVHKQFVDYLAN